MDIHTTSKDILANSRSLISFSGVLFNAVCQEEGISFNPSNYENTYTYETSVVKLPIKKTFSGQNPLDFASLPSCLIDNMN
jgi:hypothetical protein